MPASYQETLAVEIRRTLCRTGQRELPYSLLYDEIGSVLFEAITLLPEYGVTRAESRLLRTHAANIVSYLAAPVSVVELGSGTGAKTRWILEALAARAATRYYPIDLSAEALKQCVRIVGELKKAVSIEPLNLPYLDGLRKTVSLREGNQSLLVLFLGSTLGNMKPPEADSFLREIRSILQPGDGLLLGVDLQRDVEKLLLAYDDPAGVTAAFNLNLLGHANRTLGADFDLRAFRHETRYNADDHRVEMHVRSTVRQVVSIAAADLKIELAEGETIWTESSYKFLPETLREMGRRTGFEPVGQWIDEEWPFSENLWLVR